jgi:hypothetical protein
MLKKLPILIAAVVFLIAGAGGFYRLMVGFPIVIAGVAIGQTASFFEFVICAALSLILFRSALTQA